MNAGGGAANARINPRKTGDARNAIIRAPS